MQSESRFKWILIGFQRCAVSRESWNWCKWCKWTLHLLFSILLKFNVTIINYFCSVFYNFSWDKQKGTRNSILRYISLKNRFERFEVFKSSKISSSKNGMITLFHVQPTLFEFPLKVSGGSKLAEKEKVSAFVDFMLVVPLFWILPNALFFPFDPCVNFVHIYPKNSSRKFCPSNKSWKIDLLILRKWSFLVVGSKFDLFDFWFFGGFKILIFWWVWNFDSREKFNRLLRVDSIPTDTFDIYRRSSLELSWTAQNVKRILIGSFFKSMSGWRITERKGLNTDVLRFHQSFTHLLTDDQNNLMTSETMETQPQETVATLRLH